MSSINAPLDADAEVDARFSGPLLRMPGLRYVSDSFQLCRDQLEADTRKHVTGVSLTGCFCELERLDDLAQFRAGGCGRVGSVGGIDDQSLSVDVEDPQPVDLAGDLLV